MFSAWGVWGIHETAVAGIAGLWLPSLDGLRHYDIEAGDGPSFLPDATLYPASNLWRSDMRQPVLFDSRDAPSTTDDPEIRWNGDTNTDLDNISAGGNAAADRQAPYFTARGTGVSQNQIDVEDGYGVRDGGWSSHAAFTAYGVNGEQLRRVLSTANSGQNRGVPDGSPLSTSPVCITAFIRGTGNQHRVLSLREDDTFVFGVDGTTSYTALPAIPGFDPTADCTVHVCSLTPRQSASRYAVVVVNGVDAVAGSLRMWLLIATTSNGSVYEIERGWQRLYVDADWTSEHQVANRPQEGRAWAIDTTVGSMWLAMERGTAGGERDGLLYHIPDPIRPSVSVLAPVGQPPFEDLSLSWQFAAGTAGGSQASWALGREYDGTQQWWNAAAAAWQPDRVHNPGSTSQITFTPARWYETLPAADRDRAWRYTVQVTDSAGRRSPLAPAQTVTLRIAQEVTINTPPDGAQRPPTFEVKWTATSQIQAVVRAFDAAVDGDVVASEVVLGDPRTVTLATDAPDGSLWIEVTVTDTVGGQSVSDRSEVDIVNVPPAAPTMTVAEGAATITTTAAAGGPQPPTVRLETFRRELGDAGDGIRVARHDSGADLRFVDASVASGQAYEYRARATAATGSTAFSPWQS